MRLLEQLRAGPILARGVRPGTLDGAVELLAEAIPVRVDNLARWYGEDSTQIVWELNTDFPNVAPPWPVAFYEWTAPRWLNMNGRREIAPVAGGVYGALVYSRLLADVSAVEMAQTMAWLTAQDRALREGNPRIMDDLRRAGPTGIWDAVPAGMQAAGLASWSPESLDALGLAGGWWCQAWVFVSLPGHPPTFVVGLAYPVNALGQFVEPPGHPGNYIYGVEAPLFSLELARQMHANGMEPLHVPLLAMSFCHCKNVVVLDDAPPPKLAAAQLKRRGVPKITYKTLEIGPMLGTLQTEGGMRDGNSAQKALHICRGHFMDYREGAGLFGKHHGLYWKDMHVRGRNRQGVVIKDYEVAAPAKGA